MGKTTTFSAAKCVELAASLAGRAVLKSWEANDVGAS
jgi:hypothetical protein